MARVPVQAVSSDDRAALATLDSQLKQVIYGQDAAIDEVASAIKLSRSGLRSPDKPIGNFLFAGPTGVGKTELARQLARILGIELPSIRHVGVHGEARRFAVDRRASGLCRIRGRGTADRRGPQVAACCAAARRESRRPIPTWSASCCRSWTTPRSPTHTVRKADFRHVILIMTTNAAPAICRTDVWDSPMRVKVSRHAARSRRCSPRVPQPSRRHGALQLARPAEIERVVDKQIDELRAMVAPKG
jgi:ATP-dependent Clp protease ATP-binding subunit ClpA